MQKALGQSYEIFTPRMPNSENSKYTEWKIWFEKMLQFLDKGAIFVGHSLGGIFLAKYFAEEGNYVGAKAVFLLASPFGAPNFVMPKDLSKLRALGSKLRIYHSEDDDVVSFIHFKKYAKSLPHATKVIFKDKRHFIQPTFPELARDIRAIK